MSDQQPIPLDTDKFRIEVNRALARMMHDAAPDLPEIFWCITDFTNRQIGGRAETEAALEEWAERLSLAPTEYPEPGVARFLGEMQIDDSVFRMQVHCMFDRDAYLAHTDELAKRLQATRREVQTSPTPSDLPS